jgi:hypothetical protein
MHRIVSKKRAKVLSFALFLIGLAIISYLQAWWPGIMLAIGIPLALRQYMLGRPYDMCLSLFIFVGVFITVQFNITWEILLALAAIYIVFREFVESREEPLEDEEEDINHEIEEDQHK